MNLASRPSTKFALQRVYVRTCDWCGSQLSSPYRVCKKVSFLTWCLRRRGWEEPTTVDCHLQRILVNDKGREKTDVVVLKSNSAVDKSEVFVTPTTRSEYSSFFFGPSFCQYYVLLYFGEDAAAQVLSTWWWWIDQEIRIFTTEVNDRHSPG